jgi:exonuclease VII small subunit
MTDQREEMLAAFDAVRDATESWQEASERAKKASREETNCRNRLNEAQKKLDEVVGAMKKDAPRDSDWKR